MHQPTERVIKILESIKENRGGMRLAELAESLSIPKSTLLPILTTLCENNYLTRLGDKYYGGMSLMSFQTVFKSDFPIMDFVHRELTLLTDKFGETSYFGSLDGGRVLYLDKVDSKNPLRVLTSVGTRLPAYATGIGKALLIGKDENELRLLYPDGLAPITEKTVKDISALAEQLRTAEADGYAWEIEESTEYIRCFSAPVRKFGSVVFAISLAVPVFRYEESMKDDIINAVKEAADRIGALLMATDPSI